MTWTARTRRGSTVALESRARARSSPRERLRPHSIASSSLPSEQCAGFSIYFSGTGNYEIWRRSGDYSTLKIILRVQVCSLDEARALAKDLDERTVLELYNHWTAKRQRLVC